MLPPAPPQSEQMANGAHQYTIERIGLSLVYDGRGVNEQLADPAVNIVFVHGLGGHPRQTWEYKGGCRDGIRSIERNSARLSSVFKFCSKVPPSLATNVSKTREIGVFWPADLLPFVIPNARIFTYGYDIDAIGGVFQSTSRDSVLHHGHDLMVRLERAMENKKPIIFVAHSLGGIVVKVAIRKCKASSDSRYQSLYRRFDTVVFCGTPHRGSGAVVWEQLARNLVAATSPDSSLTLLRDLQVDSQMLKLIQDDFRKILHDGRIRVHTFQEGQGLTGVKGFSGKVVDNFSSRGDYQLETVETIDANHRDMVRFKNERKPGFRALSKALKGYVLTINERRYTQCIRKGNEYFKRRVLSSFIHDREKALLYFIRACDLLNPSDYNRQTYVYSKMMFVETEISYYGPFPRQKQAQHLHQAHGYGLQALEKAQLSRDATKVAEIKLMLACVKAREVKLDYFMDADDRILSRKRELIMKEINAAMINVRILNPSNMDEFEQWGKRAFLSLQKLKLGSLDE